MKLKAGEAHAAHAAAKKLATEKLPVKGKYWVSRIAGALEKHAADVDQMRNDLIFKHGEESDGNISVPSSNLKAFFADLNAEVGKEIEVDCPTLKLDLLGDAEIETDLTPLRMFIEE